MIPKFLSAALIAFAVLGASHGASAKLSMVPVQVTLAIPDSTPSFASQTQMLDLEQVFPQGAGRELMLHNCTSCHEVSLFAILRKSRDAWARSRVNHASRFSSMSDADIEVMYKYVAMNFNPDRPPSKVPPALQYLACGT